MVESDSSAFELPRSLAPAPRLSGRGFTLLLISTCLVPLFGLSLYTALFSRAHDTALAVEIGIGKEPIEAVGGQGAILTDVIWVQSQFESDVSNVTIDLNGQYFLYREAPLLAAERLVLPQQIFSTKSSQRFVPGRYPITEITVTGKLPSGRRAVRTAQFESKDSS